MKQQSRLTTMQHLNLNLEVLCPVVSLKEDYCSSPFSKTFSQSLLVPLSQLRKHPEGRSKAKLILHE